MEKLRGTSYSLRALAHGIARYADSVSMKKYGITGMQHGIILLIGMLQKDDDTFQKDVEKVFNIRPPTASKILKLMEKNDLIKRQSVKYDGRLKKLILTKRSKEILKNAPADIKEGEGVILKGIDKKEIDTFRDVAQRIFSNVSAYNTNS